MTPRTLPPVRTPGTTPDGTAADRDNESREWLRSLRAVGAVRDEAVERLHALLLKAAMERAGFPRPIDVSSTRAGYLPGTHTIGFDGPAETITLTHTARDRSAFARGALTAAQWIKGLQGWFTMRDVLGLGAGD